MNAAHDSAAIGTYVFTSSTGRALYIGASRNVVRRIGEHGGKSWWGDVADVAIHPAETWEDALAHESELIQRLSPRHNLQQNNQEAAMSIDNPETMTPKELAAAYDHFTKQAEADRIVAEKVRAFCIERHQVDLAATVGAA